MAAPPVLVLDTTTTVQVYRLPSGTGPSVAIGGALQPLLNGYYTFPVSGMEGGVGSQCNWVVAHGRYIYAFVGWDVNFAPQIGVALVRYNPNTAAWEVISITAPLSTNTDRRQFTGGIHTLIGSSGQQIIGGYWYANFAGTQQYTYWRYDPATAAYTSAVLPLLGAGVTGRTIVYRNTIYAAVSGASGQGIVAAISPVAASATHYSSWEGGGATTSGAFCVFNDRLFFMRMPAQGSATRLYEFSGGTFVDKGALPGAATGSNATVYTDATPVLFAVGTTKMVAIWVDFDGTNYGTRAADIPNPDVPGGWTSVTSTLIPAALQPSADVNKANEYWQCFTDNDTDPANPLVYLWHGSIWNTGSYSYYEYVSSTLTLGPGTAAGSCRVRLPSTPIGGGDRINYDTTNPDTDLQSVQTATPIGILGGVRLSFRVAGGTNGSAGRRTDVNYATIAALPANTWNSVAGPGAILTANANGALSVDGTPVSVGNRILVKDEATPARNGIYSVSAAGDGSNPFILLRATDFDSASATEVAAGAWCRVLSGGSLANTYWQMSQTAAITMDTTSLTWLQLVTRVVRVYYNNQYNTPMTQGTLMGTPTGLPWVTRNVNVIEGIIADDNTVYTLDWSIGAGPNTYVIRPGVS